MRPIYGIEKQLPSEPLIDAEKLSEIAGLIATLQKQSTECIPLKYRTNKGVFARTEADKVA